MVRYLYGCTIPTVRYLIIFMVKYYFSARPNLFPFKFWSKPRIQIRMTDSDSECRKGAVWRGWGWWDHVTHLQRVQEGGCLEGVGVVRPRDLSLTNSRRSSSCSRFNISMPDSTNCDSYLGGGREAIIHQHQYLEKEQRRIFCGKRHVYLYEEAHIL